jgi:hypothetical protein
MPPCVKVRFAPVKSCQPFRDTPKTHDTSLEHSPIKKKARDRSKLSCRQCRDRRVKCDETFPVCLKCDQRGLACQSEARSTQWVLELSTSFAPWMDESSAADKQLLQYWLRCASQSQTIDPDNNPSSFPIITHFDRSPSLVPTVKCISVGFATYFADSTRSNFLVRQGEALGCLQRELQTCPGSIPPSSLLTMYILALAAACIDREDVLDFGQAHLLAARVVLADILASPDAVEQPFNRFLIGLYVYWEMVCSFLWDPGEQGELLVRLLEAAVQAIKHDRSPVVGYSLDVCYCVMTLGRHCRLVISSGTRDPILEASLENKLLNRDRQGEGDSQKSSLSSLGEAFRLMGLILLYRVCGIQALTHSVAAQELDMETVDDEPATELAIRRCAMQTLSCLDETAAHCHYLNVLSLPLLTAGAELTADDADEHENVVKRFMAIYSMNRMPVHLLTVQLLREVWEAHDRGSKECWIEVMLRKKWRLMVG